MGNYNPLAVIGMIAAGFAMKVIYDKTGIDLLAVFTKGKMSEKALSGEDKKDEQGK